MKQQLVINHIRSASREMIRQLGLLDNQFSAYGTPSQCHALIEIAALGVVNMGELASLLNLDKSTMSRIVAQMIKLDLCDMQPDENDRRNKLITLTKKGRATVAKIDSDAEHQVKSALNMLSEDDKDLVVRGLSIYAKALKRSALIDKYQVRKLKVDDMPQLIKLIKTVWAEFGFDHNHPDSSHYNEELNQTFEIYSAPKSEYFVLMHDNKIIGGVGFCPLPGAKKSICELKGMYLSSQVRGLGLGTVLIKHVLHAASKIRFQECYLETMDFMHGANRLYQKSGFVKLDKPIGNTGHHWTNCWYIKKLDGIT